MVHHPVQAVEQLRRRNTCVALALISCTALVACGESGSSEEPASGSSKELPTELRAPAVGSVREADCRDWKRGTAAQRRSTVVALRGFSGGPVGSSEELKRGPVLDDGRAYKVLNSYCANRFARGFKLYKLYDRAAAFVGH